MTETLSRKWHDLLGAWAVDSIVADQAFDNVCEHYSRLGRFYHTLTHIECVLETVETLGSFAPHQNAVKLAAWLHDVIYNSRASDNEERSAAYAEQMCKSLSISDSQRVAVLILKTKTHDARSDADAQVLIDADLAILGADDLSYRNYAKQIRQEYDWVSEPEFRAGRKQVLERFVSRPRIFHFLTDLEMPARRNIAAEIARLAAD
jgi:predicted metal-dependent HD superfamily phosphohydrolase